MWLPRSGRRYTSTPGRIVAARFRFGIDVVVQDASANGARLLLPHGESPPTEFGLVANNQLVQSRICWKCHNHIGLEFIGKGVPRNSWPGRRRTCWQCNLAEIRSHAFTLSRNSSLPLSRQAMCRLRSPTGVCQNNSLAAADSLPDASTSPPPRSQPLQRRCPR
jgi:hypothetical protein